MKLTDSDRLRWDELARIARKPPCFEPGRLPFWDDPYIARQMLAAHLSPDTDAASRKPETIERSVAWIADRLGLQAGARLLDLGCGPGLYCVRFAARGFHVTGIDISENSIRYARAHDPHTTYIVGDYRALDETARYDAALLIYGDLCVLSDDDRDTVLRNVYRALRPGGRFVFDVTTPRQHDRLRGQTHWQVVEAGGFWRPGPHLVLLQTFDYPEHSTGLEQYIVIEETGAVSEYRIWTHYYTAEAITSVLEARGFAVEGLYADLTGTPYDPESEWVGVVARRK